MGRGEPPRRAVATTSVEATTLIMDAVIGEREVNFGPASKDVVARV
jgi:hypothetical protein